MNVYLYLSTKAIAPGYVQVDPDIAFTVATMVYTNVRNIAITRTIIRRNPTSPNT
ncbi:hypothetical protein SAMN04488694_1773, partial [Natrinema hispanicum]